jgi:hypothetical protein
LASLEETINQAIADFDDIEAAIEEQGVDVPYDTDTSEYGDLIRSIPRGSNIVVDQTYNGESENAQSGKALKPVLDEVWDELYGVKNALSNNIGTTEHLNFIKADKVDVFTKEETQAEISGRLSQYRTKDDSYSKTEVDTAIQTAIFDSWEVPV